MNQTQSLENRATRRTNRFAELFRSTSLRNRLLLAFIALTLLPVLITGSVASVISSQGLQDEVFIQLNSLVSLKETEINSLLKVLQTNLDLISEDQITQQNIISLLRNNPDLFINESKLRSDLLNFSKKTGYFTELFILNREGKIVLSTNDTQEEKIQTNQAYFTQGMLDRFVAPPTYEVSLDTYSIVISQPIKTGSGQTVGVLAGLVDLSTLNDIMSAGGNLGETVETYLVSTNYAALTNLQHGEFILGKTYIRTEGVTNAIRTKSSGSGVYTDYGGHPAFGAYLWIPELQLAVIAEHDRTDALQSSNRVFQTTIALILITMLAALIVAFIIARGITSPITNLVNIAESISHGNLELQADVQRNDEIGALAQAFNVMTLRLRELITTLEQRVADRTRALETSTEVSRRLSTILDEKQLTAEVVEQVKNAFNYYHVQIYLIDENSQELVMIGGTGDAARNMLARGHKITKGAGLVGRAAETNTSVLVSNTSRDADWLANPLLPETKSEIAVPISIGAKVFGVLDVQHNITDGLKQDDVSVLQAISNQIAIALQNARSYSATQQRADRESMISSINQKILSESSVESALQVAVREVGRALGTQASVRLIATDKHKE
jgi:putative methionine-R-sulfoxide reductase with GAF domain